MDQQAMQAQISLLQAMTKVCGEKTLDHRHKSNNLSDNESSAYRNCVLKFMESPQVVANAFQSFQ